MKKSHHKKRLNLISFKGGSCGQVPDVSQYTNPNGVIQAQDGYQNIFERVFIGPGAAETNLKVPNCHAKQAGGGYTFDFVDPISKQPVVKSYSDCCPPVIHNGQLFLTKGTEPQCGAGRKMSQRKVKDKKMKTSQKKSKSKSHARTRKASGGSHNHGHHCKCRPCKCPHDANGRCPCDPKYKPSSGKKSLKKSKGGGHKKSQRQKKKGQKKHHSKRHHKKQRKQRGGNESVYTADMTKREFGCKQPNWDPKCT